MSDFFYTSLKQMIDNKAYIGEELNMSEEKFTKDMAEIADEILVSVDYEIHKVDSTEGENSIRNDIEAILQREFEQDAHEANNHDRLTFDLATTQELLRLKELECEELAKDKKELVEALNGIYNEAVDYQSRSGKPVTWCLKIGKLLERLG